MSDVFSLSAGYIKKNDKLFVCVNVNGAGFWISPAVARVLAKSMEYWADKIEPHEYSNDHIIKRLRSRNDESWLNLDEDTLRAADIIEEQNNTIKSLNEKIKSSDSAAEKYLYELERIYKSRTCDRRSIVQETTEGE